MSTVLHTRNLVASYGSLRVLHGVDLDIGKGEAVALLGPNAAGKSTFLRAVSGLVKRTSGTMEFEGKDLLKVPAHQRPFLGVAQVPEGRGLFTGLTVEENLTVCEVPPRVGRPTRPLDDLFDLFPVLGGRRSQQAGTLSGGEQQMLATARALRFNPSLLLLDEPSIGLAPKLVESVFASLRSALSAGVSVLLVEQDVRLALQLAERVYVLAGGRIRLTGSTNEIDRDAIRAAYLGRRRSLHDDGH